MHLNSGLIYAARTGAPPPTAPAASASSGESAALLLAALQSRDAAEQEKLDLAERLRALQELCTTREQSLQAMKMSLKLRTESLKSVETQRRQSGGELGQLQAELDGLKAEAADWRRRAERPCDAARFAAENLELRQEVRRMRAAYPQDSSEHAQLTQARSYIWNLEQQLAQQLQRSLDKENAPGTAEADGTPVARRLRARLAGSPAAVSSPRQRMHDGAQLEVFKLEQEIARLSTELRDAVAREAAAVEAAAEREQNLQVQLAAARSAAADASRALETTRMASAMEVDRLREDMQHLLQPAAVAGSDLAGQMAALVSELQQLRAGQAATASELAQAAAAEHRQALAAAAAEQALVDRQAEMVTMETELKATITDLQTR